MFPGLDKDLAIVGVAEKGFMTLELRYGHNTRHNIITLKHNTQYHKKIKQITNWIYSVNGTGGHASLPPQHTSIGVLSAAIARLENNPHPPSLLGAGAMLDFVGRELTYPMKAVMANIWMFKWPLFSIFSKKPTLNSLIRYVSNQKEKRINKYSLLMFSLGPLPQ